MQSNANDVWHMHVHKKSELPLTINTWYHCQDARKLQPYSRVGSSIAAVKTKCQCWNMVLMTLTHLTNRLGDFDGQNNHLSHLPKPCGHKALSTGVYISTNYYLPDWVYLRQNSGQNTVKEWSEHKIKASFDLNTFVWPSLWIVIFLNFLCLGVIRLTWGTNHD